MIKLNKDYSDYVDMTDENYPNGKAVNASSSESFDGTPVVADLLNDIVGAHQAMYKKAYGNTTGVSGAADSVTSSQFADAVAKYVDDKDTAHADLRGPNAHGATVEATPGQIATRDEIGNLQVADAINDEDAVNLKLLTEGLDTKSPLAGSASLTTCSQGTFAAAATKGVDTAVTSGSGNLLTSGAVASALSNYVKTSILSVDFPANTTILEWAKSAQAGTSAEIVSGSIPSDAPTTTGEYSLLVMGNGGRKTVFAINFLGDEVYFRSVYYSDTAWRQDWQKLALSSALAKYAPIYNPVFTRGDTTHEGGQIELQRADKNKMNVMLDIYDNSFRIFSSEGMALSIDFTNKVVAIWDKNFADAAFKGVDTAVTSGSANLPTSDAVASALGNYTPLIPTVTQMTLAANCSSSEPTACTYTVIGKLCIVNIAGVTGPAGIIATGLPVAKSRSFGTSNQTGNIFYLNQGDTSLYSNAAITAVYGFFIYPIA